MMRKIIYILFFGGFLGVNAQTQIPIEFKSPQAYEMEKFGNNPISYNTGNINVSIPIYNEEIKGSKINVNLNLRNNASGFLPAKKSNFVGYNWLLDFGSSITREINGIADDYAPNNLGSYTKMGFLAGIRTNYNKSNNDIFNGNFQLGNNLFGQNNSDGIQLYNSSSGYYAELLSDKYSFNFFGITGYFMIGNDGEPIVFCDDQNIKIDLSNYANQEFYSCSPTYSEIKITDGNGDSYYFGGNSNALESSYSIGTVGESQYLNNKPQYSIMTWYLKKIVSSNLKVITFDYLELENDFSNFCQITNQIPYFNNNIQPFYDLNKFVFQENTRYNYNYDFSWGGQHEWGEGSGFNYTPPKFNINVVKKVFPKKITTENSIIDFNYITKLKVNSSEYDYYTLDNITIKNGNLDVKKINFSYLTKGYYFFLNDVTINDKKYKFDYYKLDYQLPTPTTFGVDFWGYWNGGSENTNILIPSYTLSSNTGDFNIVGTSRNSNDELIDVGLLKQITYPTKGYSIFYYEPHQYSKKIDRNSSSNFLVTLKDETGKVGGARLYKMIDNDGDSSKIFEYKYKLDYNPLISSNTSSGISNQMIRYFEYLNYSNGAGGRSTLQKETSSNLVSPTFNNTPINYKEVSEIINGELYKKYFFSSLEDVKDSLIIRKTVQSYNQNFNYKPNFLAENINLKYNNLDSYRNKLVKTIFYKNNSPIKKIENFYIKKYSDARTSNLFYSSVLTNYSWVNFYKEYIYPSLLSSTITTDYIDGNELQTKTELHYGNYDHFNLTKQKIITPNTTYETSYQYAYERINTYLIGKNVLNIPLATEEKKNGITISKTLTNYPRSETTAKARIINNTENKHFPLPFDFSKDLIINLTEPQITYDFYDTKGNLVQYTTKEGITTTIIWGYNQTQPIAKIEGATYAQVSGSIADIVNYSNTDATQGTPTSEQDLIDKLDVFRKAFPNYQITTYTYDPLIGVKSITPPSGIREIYVYDNTTNRLQSVVDVKGKILKEYSYKYKQ